MRVTLTLFDGSTGFGLVFEQTYYYADTDTFDCLQPPPSVVPELGTCALVATGVVGVGALRRRRCAVGAATR